MTRGFLEEARRLLNEAVVMEPQAEILKERIKALG
jgi:hypothetical protein